MPTLILLIGSAVFTAGAVIATRAASLMWRCLRASRWPTTTATLLEAEDQDISGAEDTTHRIRVRYTFEVGGASYEGNTLHPCYSGGSRFGKAHLELLAVLHPGQRYRVHYNPDQLDQPGQSMLSAGFHLKSVFPLLFGMELLLFATGLLAEFGWASTLGPSWFYLFGITFALILLVLLMSSDRFAARILRIP